MAPKGKPPAKADPKGAGKTGKPAPTELTQKQINIYVFCAFFASACLVVIFAMLILLVTVEETRSATDYAFLVLRYNLSDTLNLPDLITSHPRRVATETEKLKDHLRDAEMKFEDAKHAYRMTVKCNESTADGCTYLPKSRYYFSTEEKTWYDAENYCVSRDGHLASILHDDEQTYVSSQIFQPLWIGLTDTNKDGVWEWSDGMRVHNQYWSFGEPSAKQRSWDSDNDCTMIAPFSTNRNWKSDDCFKRHRWVCKTEDIISEPYRR